MSRDLAQGPGPPAVCSPHRCRECHTRAEPWAALETTVGRLVTLVPPHAVDFNIVRLREAIEYGVRIDESPLRSGGRTLANPRSIVVWVPPDA